MSSEGEDVAPPDRLEFIANGDLIKVQAIVDDETVFFAEPTPKRAEPVIRAALRTWGWRAFPELADQVDQQREDNGGAFQ